MANYIDGQYHSPLVNQWVPIHYGPYIYSTVSSVGPALAPVTGLVCLFTVWSVLRAPSVFGVLCIAGASVKLVRSQCGHSVCLCSVRAEHDVKLEVAAI